MNTYMACAGLKSCEYNVSKSLLAIHPVRRLLNAAFQMREFMETVVYGDEGKPIKIKIGVNYGRVIAGVIGFHKPQFSLIGDTVNTTSRVCSTGLVSRITISDAAYVHVKEHPFVYARREVPVIMRFDLLVSNPLTNHRQKAKELSLLGSLRNFLRRKTKSTKNLKTSSTVSFFSPPAHNPLF